MARIRRALAIAAPIGVSVAVASSAAAGARTLRVRDEGYMRFGRSSGSLVIDEGTTHGTVSGRTVVRFRYDGSPMVSAAFTITGSGWMLRGSGSGRLSSPTSTAPSFRGTLVLSGGTGRYAHAHGSGELFGVFYRRSYALSVQAIGTLHY